MDEKEFINPLIESETITTTDFYKDDRMPKYFKSFCIDRAFLGSCPVVLTRDPKELNEMFYFVAHKWFNRKTGIFKESEFLEEHPFYKKMFERYKQCFASSIAE